MRLLATTHDPWGRPVLLTQEGWKHILDGHPDMRSWRPQLLATVPWPDVITPDPTIGRWQYWTAAIGPSRWLFVVVEWRESPPTIITAYAKRKGPL